MPRPFTRAQALQNAAFLAALRRTGNAREAARALGVHRATYTKRRAGHPAFAADWDAALAVAHAALVPPRYGEGDRAKRGGGGPPQTSSPPNEGSPQSNTLRGLPEPRAVRLKSGRLQLRRAQPGRLTRAAEQAFLAALGATCNVRLSAAAAGFSHGAFYHRAKVSPGFAREMRLALRAGYDRLELALLESANPAAHADDAWRHNDPPAIPPMTADQALQLLQHHHRTAMGWDEPDHLKRRRGEPADVHAFRLASMAQASRQRERDAHTIAEAARHAQRHPDPPGPGDAPVLPALDQVTGWSNATSAKPPHDPDTALPGGWRLKDWKRGG